MNATPLKSKYRLLVLIDQSKSSDTALNNAVNIAKTVGAAIELFCVKSPAQVIKNDNQIAVLRTMSEERARTKKELQRLVNKVSDEEKIPVIYSFTFGNVIEEVQHHIDKTQPDLIVIGRRKRKLVNFLGDGLTTYLLKNYKGGVLISGDEKTRISGKDISIGFLDDAINKIQGGIAEDLKKESDMPLKLFKVKDSGTTSKEHAAEVKEVATSNTVTFEFDNGVNISNTVSRYIEKSQIGLLYVQKSKLVDLSNSVTNSTGQIQKTINKTNIPVLVLEN